MKIFTSIRIGMLRIAFAAMLVGNVSATAAANTAMILPVDPAPLVAQTTAGDRRFTIEIADTLAERSNGLMFRETMADDHGMLFVFENTRPVGFWMRNAPMPLDLIFVAEDGKVAAVLPGEPFSEAVISPDVPVRFVLELKQGLSKRFGIEPGNALLHPAIDAIAGNR